MLILRRSTLLFLLALPVAAQVPALKEPDLPLPLLAEVTPAKTAAPQMKEGSSAPPPAPTPTPPPTPSPATGADLPPPISLLPEPNAIPTRPQATPTESVVVNLINKLVERGALTKADAADLVKSAEQEAQMAQAQAQALADTQAAVAAQSALPPLEPDKEEVRVTYIPESVKEEIRSQLRSEIMADSRSQKWAGMADIPDWTRRTGLFGDIRMRYDSFMFPNGNDNVAGAFPNFNTINTGAPFDLRNTAGTRAPQLNVDQNRERYRLRMRIGFDVDLEDGFTAGIRLATGANNSPVSTNQTLGSTGSGTSAQGGNFSKYELWLDRAFVQYEASYHEHGRLQLLLGRFDNPFVTNSQIMWDEDVGLDGMAFKINQGITPRFSTFLTGGYFPVFTSYFNFANNNTAKYESYNKHLLAAQFGVSFKVTDDIEVKSTIGYYHWQNLEGRFSSPFVPASASDAGDTDNSRPAFAQKGNSYRPIRNITPTPGAPPAGNLNGTINQYQYFGLATKFRQLYWTGRVDFNHFEPVQISLLGEYIKNIGLNKAEMSDLTRRDPVVNNRVGGNGAWDGGNTAWYMGINVGKPITAFDKRGDWALGLGYRHVESDAVIDGFTDSVFGFGGTNMQGYSLNAAMALSKRTWVRMAYMSADEIAGPTLRTDVFLFDFTAKF